MGAGIRIGVDENGLGPRLGPLVVTAVRWRESAGAPGLEAVRRATGIDDSKRVFSPGRRGRGEGLARGLLAAAGSRPGSLGELLERHAVEVPVTGRPVGCAAAAPRRGGPCPGLPGELPWPRWGGGPAPMAEPLARLGIVVERVAVAVLCPGLLNAALADGTSKLVVDLRLFLALLPAVLPAGADDSVEAVCGKVGGTGRYGEALAAASGGVVEVLAEGRARSDYRVAGWGRVSFVRDADASDPAVAAASLVGKYLRELWMEALARSVGWEGPVPSGYHDAASSRLLDRLRAGPAPGRLAVPQGCIVRIR